MDDKRGCCFSGHEEDFDGAVVVIALGDDAGVAVLEPPELGTCSVTAHALMKVEGDPCEDKTGICFSTATMTVVSAKWLYVDNVRHELRAWMLRRDGDEIPCPTCAPRFATTRYGVNERVLASNVHDLQIALGYDINGDGALLENIDGVGDEWLGNAPGEVPLGALIGANNEEHGVRRAALRGVQFAVTVGRASRRSAGRPERVFDGDVLPSDQLRLRTGLSRATLRSAAIYH